MYIRTCVKPHCLSNHLHIVPANPSTPYPWLISYHCQQTNCKASFYSCDGSCNGGRRGGVKIFTTELQIKRHHKECHTSRASITPSLQTKLRRMRQGLTQHELTNNNASYHSDSRDEESLFFPVSEESGQPPSAYPDYSDYFVENECLVREAIPFSYVSHKPNSSQLFHRELMDGNAMKAASILVIRASLQRKCNPTGRTDDAVQPSNILLFLYLSKLVIGIGQFQEKNLSKVMKSFFRT